MGDQKTKEQNLKNAVSNFSVHMGCLQTAVTPRSMGQIGCPRSCWKAQNVSFHVDQVACLLEQSFESYEAECAACANWDIFQYTRDNFKRL